MSGNWDIYFTMVEDTPAAMLVDLDFGSEAPIPGLSVLCSVIVDLREPDQNGMAATGELEALACLEDALVGALTHETSIFVGVCTAGGRREFFFYMDTAKGVEERVEGVMERFADYIWDMGLVEEPGWDTYLDFLYPDEREMDGIWNSRICRDLEAQGDDLARPREIVHTLHFPNQNDMGAFVLEAEREGFVLACDGMLSGNRILARRMDVPEDLDSVTWALRELAGVYGGEYEGWECPPIGGSRSCSNEGL